VAFWLEWFELEISSPTQYEKEVFVMNRKLTVVDLKLVVYVSEHRFERRPVREMELGCEIGFERGVGLEVERRRKYRGNQELFDTCCHFLLVISLNS